MIPKLLQFYWRFSRPTTLGAQGCVLTPENEVLLVRHTYRKGWHFPGGGVERKETTREALIRELREEAGVIVQGEPELHGIFANFKVFTGDHVVLYVVREWEQPEAPKPNYEIAEQRFFPIDALPDDLHPSPRRRLDEIFGSSPIPVSW